jgi:hypothetical protein
MANKKRGRAGGSAVNPPSGVPERPPWFASDEQYDAFLKIFAKDLGSPSITARSIDVEHLDEDDRRNLLSKYAIEPTLRVVSATYARLDAAALFSRDSDFEKRFVRSVDGGRGAKSRAAVGQGKQADALGSNEPTNT